MTIVPTTITHTHTQGPAVLRPRRVRQLLQTFDLRRRRGRRDAALLAILGGDGPRVGEATRFTIDQIEQAAGGRVRITVRTGKQRQGGPPRWRTVTLAAVGLLAHAQLPTDLGYRQPPSKAGLRLPQLVDDLLCGMTMGNPG